MSNLRQLFEKELKNKLSLKSSGHTSEETVLLKAFKYFDLDNSGNCSKEEFLKTISKIGITGFTDKNLMDIFDIYDVNKNEELDYKEFIGGLFNNTSIAKPKQVQPEEKKTPVMPAYSDDVKKLSEGKSKQAYINADGIADIIQKIREKLAARGVRGIISLGKNFRIIDDDNSRSLDFLEFKKASRDFRFDLSDLEVEKAFAAFDRTGDGTIDYDEFLRGVRGSMSTFRRNLVSQAFAKLDKDQSGMIELSDIKGVYNAKFHPDVKNGKKTEDEVLLEFLETFEQHHNFINSNAPDHIVTKEEFMEYYENVSMSIDDDAYFELMMCNSWRMGQNTTYNNEKKGWANKDESPNVNISEQYSKKKTVVSQSPTKVQSQAQEEPQVTVVKSTGHPTLDKFRDRLLSRGGKGIIGLARQFKIFDDNNSKTLEFDEFAKAIKDFKVEISPNEVKVLYGIFDRDGEGTIDYDEFLRAIRGEMNDRRKKIVLQAFDKLDTDKSGVIDLNEVRSLYNAKNHPAVRSGQKTEEDVYGEFLETFETHHNINKGVRDRRVTQEEFLEYYNNISMSIDTDDYFEAMINAAWKLGPVPDYTKQKAWAADVSDKKVNVRSNIRMGKPGLAKNAPFGTTDEPTNYATSSNQKGNVNTFSKKGDETVLKFRDKLAARGTRGIMGIRRSFKICDDNNSRTIEFDEFAKLMKDYRVGLTDQDMKKLFAIFDTDKSGQLDYDEFIKGIVGEMNDFRKALVKKAFMKLDKNQNEKIELDDIRGTYNASNHPDVRQGKKTEDEVLAEFLDNFEYHFSLLNDKQTKDRTITLEEFIEYYNNISMSIDDDKYFELMMITAWNLENKGPYQKGWRGEN